MLLSALFESRSLESPAVPLTGQTLNDYIFGDDGLAVNPTTAMGLPAVYAAIYVLGSSLAQLPLGVLRKSPDGNIAPGIDHAAYDLLRSVPNEWQTSYKWRETGMNHVLGWGNGYTRVVRSPSGELRSLERCLPWQTSLIKPVSRYVYSTFYDDQPLAVQMEDMIHIRALGSDGRMGISPIRQHMSLIGLGLSAQKYGKDFFDGGGRASGLVTPKGELGKEAWDRLKMVWRESVSRLNMSKNKTMLLPAELLYQQLMVAPEEAQFIETRKLNWSEVAAIFNIPPHMIGYMERATFANISEQAIQFVRSTIMPWVVNWEQELNRRLFTRAERAAGYYVKFNLAGLMRGTAKERAAFYHYAITDGWMDRNEVRALEDMNPRDGLSEMLVSVNAKTPGEIQGKLDREFEGDSKQKSGSETE